MTPRRSSRKVTPRFESLDARVVPSATPLTRAELAAFRAEVRAQQAELRAERVQLLNAERASRLAARMSAHVGAQAAAIQTLPVASTTPAAVPASTWMVASPAVVSTPAQTMTTAPAVQAPLSVAPPPAVFTFTPTAAAVVTTPAHTTFATTTTNATTTTTTPTPPNVDSTLGAVFQTFQASGADGVASSPQASVLIIQGSNVGVDVHWNQKVAFSTEVSALTGLGMQVQASDAASGNIVGMLPMGQIAAAAQLPGTMSLTANYRHFRF